ncbi:MAG: hypothetical protein K0R22_1412 [Sporomusa sp.]|jgi:hypothetical protein|nr:hypothetical protein [Sporomusa sp.]
MEFVLWIGFCVGIGYYAQTKGRNSVVWGLIAFIISPLIAGIILALMKDNKIVDSITEIKMDHQQLRDRVETNEKIADKKFEQLGLKTDSSALLNNSNETLHIADSDYKTCPYCKERIKKNAIRCKHCQAMIDDVVPELCPFCQEDILSIDKVCTHCKAELNRDNPKIIKQETV